MKKRLDAIEDKLSPDEDMNGVWFSPLKDETDENGRFLIKNTPAGDMVVEVFHKNSSELVKVTIEQGETSQCPDIIFS